MCARQAADEISDSVLNGTMSVIVDLFGIDQSDAGASQAGSRRGGDKGSRKGGGSGGAAQSDEGSAVAAHWDHFHKLADKDRAAANPVAVPVSSAPCLPCVRV